MAFFLSPLGNTQIIDANGDPLVGGTIETFLAGTSTPETTYTDDAGGTPQGVVMTLNSLGYPENGPVWMLGGVPLKFIIKNSLGVVQSTFDDISGIGDTATAVDQWTLYGAGPTYLSAISFSVVGDQTTNTFQVGRRLKSTNSGGTVYSTITASAFSLGVTTITVVNTSGVLDAGLSAVSYGVLTADDPSIPTSAGVRLAVFSNGASVASAATINISAIPGMNFHVTGTVATSAVTMASGQWAILTADAAWPLTYNATTNRINTGGANTTLAANDRVLYYFDGTTVYGQIFRNSAAGYSQLRLNTTNGHGATSTTVRRWLNVVENTGGDHTYSDSATLGGVITTNIDATWAISYADSLSVAAPFGPTLNSAQLTTAFVSITAANRLAFGYTPATDIPGCAPVTLYLPAGSIIRCQTNGTNSADTSRATFTMTRVS